MHGHVGVAPTWIVGAIINGTSCLPEHQAANDSLSGVSHMTSNDGRDGRPSLEIARPSDFERGWFAQSPVPSWPPPSIAPPASVAIASAASSAGLGTLSGALGGVIMLIVTQSVLVVRHSNVDLVRGLGGMAAHALGAFSDPRVGGVVSAAVTGALLGAPLGFMARRLLRIVPRLLFFTLLLPILWLFVRALIIGKVAAGTAVELPFAPLLVGWVVYGICVAVVAPPRAR